MYKIQVSYKDGCYDIHSIDVNSDHIDFLYGSNNESLTMKRFGSIVDSISKEWFSMNIVFAPGGYACAIFKPEKQVRFYD